VGDRAAWRKKRAGSDERQAGSAKLLIPGAPTPSRELAAPFVLQRALRSAVRAPAQHAHTLRRSRTLPLVAHSLPGVTRP
jgi:hypothetical protein